MYKYLSDPFSTQVRFGILEAGAFRSVHLYGSPEETLLGWPDSMHAFSAPELKVALSGNKNYAAVRSTQAGVPFRAITL